MSGRDELERLQERLNRLASDKSYLQLIIHMTNRLNAVVSLENIVLAIPSIILDSIGGTNIKLYYFIDQNIHYSDALGNYQELEDIDDEMVLNAKSSTQAVFLEHDFSDTMMTTSEFEKAWDWAYPLCVKSDVVGVLKMENLHIGVDAWMEYLPTFFGYCALLLKNEILGFTKLKKAYDELAKEIDVRKEAEEELETINNKLSSINAELEEEIACRMETEGELQSANLSLKELTTQLEMMVEERTRELSDLNKKLECAYGEWIQAMDSFDDIIYLLDDKRRVIRANKKFYTSYNVDHEQSVGKLISDIAHPNLEPKGCRICCAQIHFHDSVFELDRDDTHNPSHIPIEVTVKIIKNMLGEPTAILTSIHDISHTKVLEQELRVLNESLEIKIKEELAKNREKDILLLQQSRLAAMGEMVGAIAHQWRQPLNSLGVTIQDVYEAYKYGELNEEYIIKFKSEAMSVIQRMSRTIDDFRNYFRPDKKEQEFVLENAIEQVLSLVLAQLENNFITVHFQKNSEHVVCGFKNEIEQAILIIVSNAKDALVDNKTEEPQIWISVVGCEDGKTRLTIEDNGGGIPEAIIQRIFEPYFTTKEQGKGVGIGLYMTREIIERHMHGKIWAENSGAGARFIVELGKTC